MSFYYLEIKDGAIISYGESTGVDQALLKTEGAVMEITQKEYALVSACRGNIGAGRNTLRNLDDKIKRKTEEIKED